VVALGENRSGQLVRPKAIRSFLPAERVPAKVPMEKLLPR
jgi:hypothetical protein